MGMFGRTILGFIRLKGVTGRRGNDFRQRRRHIKKQATMEGVVVRLLFFIS